MIRSQDYMRTKLKQASSKAIYRLVTMDLFATESKAYHVAKHLTCRQQVGRHGCVCEDDHLELQRNCCCQAVARAEPAREFEGRRQQQQQQQQQQKTSRALPCLTRHAAGRLPPMPGQQCPCCWRP